MDVDVIFCDLIEAVVDVCDVAGSFDVQEDIGEDGVVFT